MEFMNNDDARNVGTDDGLSVHGRSTPDIFASREPPASPLLNLLSVCPEIALMACPPECAVMLLKTNKTFGTSKFLRAKLQARRIYDVRSGTEWPGFLHGMGLAEALTPLLAKLAGVTTLDLCGMRLCSHGARVLACILRDPKTKIERLGLDCNGMGYNVSAEEVLSNPCIPDVATRFPPVLAFLAAHETQPAESGIAALVDALLTNETVKYLNLETNTIRGEDLPHLLRLARESRTLQVLKIGINHYYETIDLAPASLMSELVTSVSQSTLHVLSMCPWLLDQKTAVAIIRALRTNKTLQVLDISEVHFNESVLINALRYALQENTTLTTLHIHAQSDDDSSISRLRVEQSMPRPFTLKFERYQSRN